MREGRMQIRALTFDARKAGDGELMAKLNAAAPYHRQKAHTLARSILMEYLNKFIDENGIDWQYGFSPADVRPG